MGSARIATRASRLARVLGIGCRALRFGTKYQVPAVEPGRRRSVCVIVCFVLSSYFNEGNMISSEMVNDADVLLQKGLAAANAGDKERAKALLHRASELDPDNEA